MPQHIHTPAGEENKDAIASIFKAVKSSREASAHAAGALLRHSPVLIKALRTGSGQGEKVSRIIRSVWNGHHKTGLCDDLAGLDHEIGLAVLALIAARIHMGGDADAIIRAILVDSGEYQRLCDEVEREA